MGRLWVFCFLLPCFSAELDGWLQRQDGRERWLTHRGDLPGYMSHLTRKTIADKDSFSALAYKYDYQDYDADVEYNGYAPSWRFLTAPYGIQAREEKPHTSQLIVIIMDDLCCEQSLGSFFCYEHGATVDVGPREANSEGAMIQAADGIHPGPRHDTWIRKKDQVLSRLASMHALMRNMRGTWQENAALGCVALGALGLWVASVVWSTQVLWSWIHDTPADSSSTVDEVLIPAVRGEEDETCALARKAFAQC